MLILRSGTANNTFGAVNAGQFGNAIDIIVVLPIATKQKLN
jgi:hypothetical protein